MGLSLKLLGEFAVRDQTGKALSLPTRKTRALLAYLAANAGRPQLRDRLMALLWSDRGEQQARHSLNQALTSIRRLGNAAGVTLLHGDGERVTLLADMLAIDLANFRDKLADDPAGAAVLYEGPFLDGTTIPDPAFEDWLTAIRSELHNNACDALSRAADQATKIADTANGIDLLRRLVALDPLREEAHRRLMKSLYDNGDRAGALSQYQTCADILKKELQVEPDTVTKALFEAIRSNASSAIEQKPATRAQGSGLEDSPLSLPDKPSIAVLPFTNLSADPDQEFFADGITEDIITALSRFRSLFVIARNSTFSYKGKSPDVREIVRDLGVRYVLEGSVRKSDKRIRIAGQLIDAENGSHLWAERFDRNVDDIFLLQDEVTEAIVAAIAPEIDDAERERAQRKPPGSLDAWDIYQRGLTAYHTSTEEAFRLAIEHFDRASEIDQNFAPALAMAASARWRYVLLFEPANRNQYLTEAREKAYKAMTLDSRDSTCLWCVGRVQSMLGDYDAAILKIEEAIALNPNDAMARFNLGAVLCTVGRTREAINHIDDAMRLSPRDKWLVAMLTRRAFCLFDLKCYEEALEWARRASLSPHPRPITFAVLTAVLAKLGRRAEAQAALDELLACAPGMSCRKFRRNPSGAPEAMEQLADALRAVGLPE